MPSSLTHNVPSLYIIHSTTYSIIRGIQYTLGMMLKCMMVKVGESKNMKNNQNRGGICKFCWKKEGVYNHWLSLRGWTPLSIIMLSHIQAILPFHSLSFNWVQLKALEKINLQQKKQYTQFSSQYNRALSHE